jgi:DMSO reductase anchor subunit
MALGASLHSIGVSLGLLAAACLVQYAGLVAERWFFFAEAKHPQNLYYARVG